MCVNYKNLTNRNIIIFVFSSLFRLFLVICNLYIHYFEYTQIGFKIINEIIHLLIILLCFEIPANLTNFY